MNSTLSTTKREATPGTIKFSARITQIPLIVESLLMIPFYSLLGTMIEFSQAKGYSMIITIFGEKRGNIAFFDSVSVNNSLSSFVFGGIILWIILVIIGAIYLNVIFEYICLAVNVVLVILSMVNLCLINSVTIQAASQTSVNINLWMGFIFIMLFHLSFGIATAVKIFWLKKLQRMQS